MIHAPASPGGAVSMVTGGGRAGAGIVAAVVTVIVPPGLPARAGVVVVVTMEIFAAVTVATAYCVSPVGQALCLALRTCSLSSHHSPGAAALISSVSQMKDSRHWR